MAKKMLVVQEEVYRKQYQLSSSIIIPSNLYGKYDNFSLTDGHVIPALVRKFYEVKHGIKDKVDVWGDGKSSRDFISATDVARAIILLLSGNYRGTYNVGQGHQHSISQVVEALQLITGVDKIEYDISMPSGQKSREFSVEKFLGINNSFKAMSLVDGLKHTYDWFSENIEKGGVRL